MAAVDGWTAVSAGFAPREEAALGSETAHSGTEEMKPAACGDGTAIAISLPEVSRTRANEFMANVDADADTAVQGKEDPDVGRSNGIAGPGIEVPSELSCAPAVSPTEALLDGLGHASQPDDGQGLNRGGPSPIIPVPVDGPEYEAFLDVGLQNEEEVAAPQVICSGDPEAEHPRHQELRRVRRAAAVTRSPRFFSKVYNQRRRLVKSSSDLAAPPLAVASPSTPSPRRAGKEFIKRLSKKTTKILLTPCISRRKQQRLPPGAPRRSRRLAGIGVESPKQPAPSRFKKRVMRSLDIISEQEGIDQQALEEYAKFFTQPLSASHIQALAALFGWSSPDEEVLMT